MIYQTQETVFHWDIQTLISVTFPVFVSYVYLFFIAYFRVIPYGLAVRIPGFHPGGPGSTPGMGTHFLQ